MPCGVLVRYDTYGPLSIERCCCRCSWWRGGTPEDARQTGSCGPRGLMLLLMLLLLGLLLRGLLLMLLSLVGLLLLLLLRGLLRGLLIGRLVLFMLVLLPSTSSGSA